MKCRFWEIVITHKDHFDSEIQIDFKTRRGALKFVENHLGFQDLKDWEVYLNYNNVKKGIFSKQERLA